jgi:hypothetical protein
MDDIDDQIKAVAASGLFDARWYLACNIDVAAAKLDPVDHFCKYGWREERAPNTWFDPGWYLAQNTDVAAHGLNPLLHYASHGEQEGRRPSPYFDPTWYRSAHGLPADTSPLRHYLTHRAERNLAPCAMLYAVPYLPQYAERNVWADPYRGYLDDAVRAGRAQSPDEALIAHSNLLDPNYYFINSGDVRQSGLEPVEHFCRYGWQENRKPNLHFNPSWYAETNPSVARLGINPLVHYICEGEAQGRRPVIYFDPAWYAAEYREALMATGLRPLAHYLAHRRSQAFSPNDHFNVEWYVARHGAEIGPNREPFVHYLQAGTTSNIDPSPDFDVVRYRRDHLGRLTRAFRHRLDPERDNPLLHFLRARYH